MKRRILALALAAALVLGLCPLLAGATEEVVVPVYTIRDIQENAGRSGRTLILMQDIDAAKEDFTYYRASSTDGMTVCQYLASDVVLDGNGHTIYNLQSALFRNNSGTIRNLGVTLVYTEETERRVFLPEANLVPFAIGCSGLIEDCYALVKLHREQSAASIAIHGLVGGISSGGVVRNCVTKVDVDMISSGGAWITGGISISGLVGGRVDGLLEHCLVYGTLKGEGDRYSCSALGIATISSSGKAKDCACALDELSLICDSQYYFSPGFNTYTGNTAGAEGCRVASDLYLYDLLRDKGVQQEGYVQEGPGYTLASRESILADWDLSRVPGEEPPEHILPPYDGKFPRGNAQFYYSASDNTTHEYYFYYDNDMFYTFDPGYRYNRSLAVASLCLAMSAFTNVDNLAWDVQQAEQVHSRAFNVERLYDTLGFSEARYYEYNVPLTSTDDKVACSMAMKYIQNPRGELDTLVAVPLRGGGYGGEWGSNFDLTYYGYEGDHHGFASSAATVQGHLTAYLNDLKLEGKLKGEVKLWITGFSRAAAVSNLLAHNICAAGTLGAVELERKNVYAYTFATPRGVNRRTADDMEDPNIFNIISPVDAVPNVAPAAWHYGRYGIDLTLPYENNSVTLEGTYRSISGVEDSDVRIMPAQRSVIRQVMEWITAIIPDADAFFDRGIQIALEEAIGSSAGTKDVDDPKIAFTKTAVLGAADVVSQLRHPLVSRAVKALSNEAANLARAHHPEMYLARLLTDELNTEGDFHSSSRQIVIDGDHPSLRILDVFGDPVPGVTVESTSVGLVATIPGAEGDCFVSLEGGATAQVTVYSYDDRYTWDNGLARTAVFHSLDLSEGGCTLTLPQDPFDDVFAEAPDGDAQYPDWDDLYDDQEDRYGFTPSISFTDVPEDAWYADAVAWAVERGITNGTGDGTTFSPEVQCTRGQIVTLLWRADGCPQPVSRRSPFADVTPGSYCYDAVLWAVERGITNGTGDGTAFSPDAVVSRAQAVTFLCRYMGGWAEEPETMAFQDVALGSYYADAVGWAVESGITNGTSPVTFSPDLPCSRCQIVTFMYRALAD